MNRSVRRRVQAGLLALAFVVGVLMMLHEPEPATPLPTAIAEPRTKVAGAAHGPHAAANTGHKNHPSRETFAAEETVAKGRSAPVGAASAANGSRDLPFLLEPFATEVAPTVLRSSFAPVSDTAPTAPDLRGRLAIVIDDIGWARAAGERVIALPGRLTLAVLPGTPAGEVLSRRAHAAGHEVILHQPMAAHGNAALGPGGLQTEVSGDEITRIVAANLDALPHRAGLSNHMGSLLTARKDAMRAVMNAAAPRGLYFLDSRTTADTVAQSTARALAVPSIRRDLFLDDSQDPERVEAALDSALELAETRGHAVVIGHPHEVTLGMLERRMEEIRERVRLVPVSSLLPGTGSGQASAD